MSDSHWRSAPRLRLLLALGLAGITVSARAQQVTIEVRNHGEHATTCEVRLEPSAMDHEPVDLTLKAPGTRSVELPPGDPWTVEVTADARWPDSAVVVPRAGVEEHATIDLWPVGTLTATIRVGADEVAPTSLRARFSAPHGLAPIPGFPEDEVICPVADGQMRCVIPSGKVDLRLRAQGMVSHYRWNQAVATDRTTDLGTLELQPGASVTGWVVAAEGRPDLSSCTLELSRLGPEPDTSVSRQVRQRCTAKRSGFFHLSGVAPGLYALEARLPTGSSARFMPLTVMENAETALSEPLVLHPPATLEIEVDPPSDPWSRPWKVTVSERAAAGSITLAVDEVAELGDGRWRWTGLERATHVIRVEDRDGDSWWHEELQVETEHSTARIEMPIIAVEGLVHSGDDPVSGVVLMGGLRGSPRVRIHAGEDGSFSGYLPREGPWTITVIASKGRLQRSFTRVPIHIPEGEEAAWVDLEIAATSIRGIVVDELDQPVAQASVIITRQSSADLPPTVRTDHGGEFQIDGIPEGPLVVEARTAELLSDPMSLDLTSDEPLDLRLTLRAMKRVAGRVLSHLGAVPGASIDALPVGATIGSSHPTVRTQVDGSFELRLPSAATHVHLQVMAPGFAMRYFLAELGADATLDIPLDQQGGRIVLDGAAANAAGRLPVLLHGGSFATPAHLWQWLRMNGLSLPSGQRLEVPGMEPGDYIYCEVSLDQAAQLVAGILPVDRCSMPQRLVAGGELLLGESAER